MSTKINYDAMVAAIRHKFSQPRVCHLTLGVAYINREGLSRPVLLLIESAADRAQEVFTLDKTASFQRLSDLPLTTTVHEALAPIEVFMPAQRRELNHHLVPLDTTIELPADDLLKATLESISIDDVKTLGEVGVKLTVMVPKLQYRSATSAQPGVPLECLFSPSALQYIYDSGIPSQDSFPRYL